MEAITLEEGLPARMLAMVDGERRMTDLRHVGELLHAAAMTEQMGATALTAWLRQRVLEATTDNNDEERSRRLESDAEAVQVLTMHRSKGLEFPVVYYPDLWEPSWIPRENTSPVTFHDAAGVRTIDVGLDGPQWKGHVAQHVDEQRGEDLRLAYVALTRAKHQAVVWWAGSYDSRNSALSRLLFARDDEGNIASSGAAVPSDEVGDGTLPRARGRQRRALGARPDRLLAGRRRRDRDAVGVLLRPHARLVVAAHLLQRHHGRHLRAARGERAGGGRRRRRGRRRTRRRSRTTGGMASARCPRCSPRWPPAPSWARSSTASSSRSTSRRRISTSRSPRRSPPPRRGGGSSSATSTPSSPASARRSRRPWGQCPAASP